MLRKIILSFVVTGVCFSLVSACSPAAHAVDSKAESEFNKTIVNLGGSTSNTLPASVKNIINLLLYVAGIIAVIIMVVSGIRFITSDGNAQTADKARNTIVYASVGLVVAVLSYAIVNFVLDRV